MIDRYTNREIRPPQTRGPSPAPASAPQPEGPGEVTRPAPEVPKGRGHGN